MPADDPRTELARVAASLRAYLEVQAETGAWGVPRAVKRAAPVSAAPPTSTTPRTLPVPLASISTPTPTPISTPTPTPTSTPTPTTTPA